MVLSLRQSEKIFIMKKYAVVSLLLMFSLGIFGKDKDTRSGIGFKGGLVLSTAGFPEEKASEQKNRMKLGGFGGICYERQFGNVVAFELEAMYATLGTNQKSTILGNKVSFAQNFHVAQLPINLKFYIGNNFNLYVGGYGQYMFAIIGRTVTKNSSGDVINDDKSKNLLKDDLFNAQDSKGVKRIMPWDAGVQGGMEFISNMGLGVGARFQKGLIDITNDKFTGILNDGKWVTNTSLQIYLVGHF
jgi:Outer membrane protein beta-barrel domain